MTNNTVFSEILTREIIQVRFRPTLDWYSKRAQLASELESKYEEWSADNGGNTALFSPKKKRALEVFTDQITFVAESDLDSSDGYDHIVKLIPGIIEKCSVKEIRRVGCRRTYIFGSKFGFTELTDLLHQRLFCPDKKVLSLQPGKVNDLAYVMDTKDGNCLTHVQIGAINKTQGLDSFKAKFEMEKQLKSDDNLFVDIDVYVSEKIDTTNIIENLKKVIQINHETVTRYIDFLSK